MKIKDIVKTGILIAIIFVSLLIVHFPVYGLDIHPGSFVIIIICLTFDKKQALIATIISCVLHDLLFGHIILIPFTFLARSVMALVICKAQDKTTTKQIIYTTYAGIFVAIIYFIATLTITNSINLAMLQTIPNIIQLVFNAAAVYIAIPIRKVLKSIV